MSGIELPWGSRGEELGRREPLTACWRSCSIVYIQALGVAMEAKTSATCCPSRWPGNAWGQCERFDIWFLTGYLPVQWHVNGFGGCCTSLLCGEPSRRGRCLLSSYASTRRARFDEAFWHAERRESYSPWECAQATGGGAAGSARGTPRGACMQGVGRGLLKAPPAPAHTNDSDVTKIYDFNSVLNSLHQLREL